MMKKNVKILYIASNRFPTEKAHGYQIVKMCEAFSRQNQVLLLYPRKKNTKELKNVKDIHRYYSIQGIFSTKSLFCLDLTFLKKVRIPKLWFLTSSLSYALSTFFWVIFHKKKFDVIYSRAPFSLFLLSFLRRIIGVRIIYESHTFPASDKSFRLNLAKKVDKMVVVTKKTKELYIRAGVKEDHIIVEPSAVDMSQFDLKISKASARKKLNVSVNMLMVSYVGQFHTMEMEKGIPEIIQSARYLVKEFPNIYFYFVGGPLDREKKYRNIINEIHLPQDRFVFLGKQPVKELPYWLKASDILLMPHPKNIFYSYYVSPLKMFEYMASKRPIVGSKLPAVEEILTDGKNALLGRPGDPGSIAKLIRTLLLNHSLREELSDQAFRDVKEYTWDKRVTRILNFLGIGEY